MGCFKENTAPSRRQIALIYLSCDSSDLSTKEKSFKLSLIRLTTFLIIINTPNLNIFTPF